MVNKSRRQDPDLWHSKPLSRYTSYPPAPLFHKGISSSTSSEVIQSLSKMAIEKLTFNQCARSYLVGTGCQPIGMDHFVKTED